MLGIKKRTVAITRGRLCVERLCAESVTRRDFYEQKHFSLKNLQKIFFNKKLSAFIEKQFFFKLIFFILFTSKTFFPLRVRKVLFSKPDIYSVRPRARVFCVILAHAAMRVTFHRYLRSTCTKQYSAKFLRS